MQTSWVILLPGVMPWYANCLMRQEKVMTKKIWCEWYNKQECGTNWSVQAVALFLIVPSTRRLVVFSETMPTTLTAACFNVKLLNLQYSPRMDCAIHAVSIPASKALCPIQLGLCSHYTHSASSPNLIGSHLPPCEQTFSIYLDSHSLR